MARGVPAICSGLAAMVLAAPALSGAGDRSLGVAVTASAAKGQGEKPNGPPPLVVDRSAPLLLDEPAKAPADAATGPVADNSACFVCHDNYQEESLVGWHAVEEIGCVDCHGTSTAHRNDENNTTPPEIMYAADKIDQSCRECHDVHDVPAREVIARLQERCPQKTDSGQLVCTDCHGEHRLKARTVRWDKETGELIVRDAN